MKKIFCASILIFLVLFSTGCSKEKIESTEEYRAVKIEKIEKIENPVILEYVGIVNSKELIKYSFKTPGKIEKVFVEKGDYVKKGDSLAQLDLSELNFQLDAAEDVLNTAKADIEKAREAMEYDKDNLEKMEKLLNENAISRDTYDQLSLKLKVSIETFNQANSQFNAAKTDFEYKKFLVDNGTIAAQTDGRVAEILYRENEQIAAYYPIVVIRSDVSVVNVGIAQKDLMKIKEGTSAEIDNYGDKVKGYLNYLSETPDEETMTYNGEVILEDNDFRIGTIVDVNFNLGDTSGIWIPIFSIMNDGEDFVYVVENNRAYKKIIEIESIYDSNMLVKGIEAGDLLIVEGMKNLSDGMLVMVNE